MYVDKKLAGLHAVQTLSRLNRTHPNKAPDDIFVLDFVNARREGGGLLDLGDDMRLDFYKLAKTSEGRASLSPGDIAPITGPPANSNMPRLDGVAGGVGSGRPRRLFGGLLGRCRINAALDVEPRCGGGDAAKAPSGSLFENQGISTTLMICSTAVAAPCSPR